MSYVPLRRDGSKVVTPQRNKRLPGLTPARSLRVRMQKRRMECPGRKLSMQLARTNRNCTFLWSGTPGFLSIVQPILATVPDKRRLPCTRSSRRGLVVPANFRSSGPPLNKVPRSVAEAHCSSGLCAAAQLLSLDGTCCVSRNTVYSTCDSVIPAQGFAPILRIRLGGRDSAQARQTAADAAIGSGYVTDHRRYGNPWFQPSSAQRTGQGEMVGLG